MFFKKESNDKKYDRIIKLLKKRGEEGVYNYELNKIAFRYGDIIFKLRKDGWNITTHCINSKTGLYKFTLHE